MVTHSSARGSGGSRWLKRYKAFWDTLSGGKPMQIMTHSTPHKTVSTQSFPRSVKKHHALASNHIGHARLPPVFVENFMHPKHEVFQHNILGGSRFPCAPVLSKNSILASTGGYRKFETSGTCLQRLFLQSGSQTPLTFCSLCARALQVEASYGGNF